MQKNYHIVLRNDIQEIPRLSILMETVAEEAGLDPGLAMSLNLALEEAVTNVVLYAYPEGAEGFVEIDILLEAHYMEFTVIDSGVAFDPTAKPDPDLTLGVEERPIGGLGIFLVKQIMDKVLYERKNDRNYLRMIKKIQ